MRKLSLPFIIFLITLFSLKQTQAYGSTDLEYPELLVTPSATERLYQEAKEERDNKWTVLLPMQISATTTFTAGLIMWLAVTDLNPNSGFTPGETSLAGLIVGGGWLATTFLLSNYYTPYAEAWKKINPMPVGAKHQKLAKERMAESAIENPAWLAVRLKWLSVLTNLGASAFMLSQASSNKHDFAMIAAGTAMLSSFAPLIFSSNWERTNCEHQEYKTRHKDFSHIFS